MELSIDAARSTGVVTLGRLRGGLPVALLTLLLVLTALQRGGYYAESWSLPTIACGWIVALAGLLGERQRLRRLELVLLGGLGGLGLLTLASAAWTPGGLGTALPPAQLLAFYVAALAAVLVLFRRGTAIVTTLWASLLFVSVIGLGTRLFPSSVSYDPTSQNRLYEPLGYWNSLGLWAAMGLCLSVALVARSRSLTVRALAAAGTVPCAATLYFTFSRGAWIALAIGLVAALLIDPRRLGLIAWIGLAAPWAAVGVWLASRSKGLTSLQPALATAQADGRALALWLVLLSLGAGATTLLLALVERRVTIPARLRSGFAIVVLLACVWGLAGGMIKFGSPMTIAHHVKDRFSATPVQTQDLNSRLFDANGSFRAEIWRAAIDDAKDHPLKGSGAGSFASEWLLYRGQALDVENAHQLYLETLAELGPLGLALLAAGLFAPLMAAWRARRHPLAAGVTAAYAAFIVHAALDWDWQLASVTLAGLACGACLLVMARGSRSPRMVRRDRIGLAVLGLALAGFALWSVQGTLALGEARDAAAAGQWVSAESHARDAVSETGGFSSAGWIALGEAQTALKQPSAAQVSLRTAVQRDPGSWQAWFDLANVATGAERQAAIKRAYALNPLDADTQALEGVGIVTP
jgi:hypothetical protein